MKLNKKQLPIFAAVVQTAQYALAGFFLIGHIGWFFVGSMGALVSLAMAYGASQYSDIAKNRKPGALAALVGLMCLSPIVVGTATWLHLTDIVNPYWRGVVAFAWGVLPDGAVVLAGFIAGRGLFEQPTKKPKKPQNATLKPSKKPKKVADKVSKQPIPDAELIAFFTGNPDATNADAARHFRVSHTAIGKRAKKLFAVKP